MSARAIYTLLRARDTFKPVNPCNPEDIPDRFETCDIYERPDWCDSDNIEGINFGAIEFFEQVDAEGDARHWVGVVSTYFMGIGDDGGNSDTYIDDDSGRKFELTWDGYCFTLEEIEA